MAIYGYELILDISDADPATFTRANLEAYFVELCEAIDMVLVETHIWDDLREEETRPQVKGISAVAFIETSSITIHALDLLCEVYVNIFSCKSFDPAIASEVTNRFFKTGKWTLRFLQRGQ